MKKTVKAIRRSDLDGFNEDLQNLVDDGFEIKFSNAYVNEKRNVYYALLIKEESESDGTPLPISGGR